jgi:RNA polymerase sigma factor (sigma-70 family)
MLEFVSSFHSDWIRIAYSFLGNKEDAEDIVQSVYLRLHKYNVQKEKIMYKNTINRFFMYNTIKNECLQFIRNQNNDLNIDDIKIDLTEETNERELAYNRIVEKIDKEIETWDYFDKNLFEVYMYSGLSYRAMSGGTEKVPRLISRNKFILANVGNGIGVSSMSTTIKKCKLKLIEKFGEDFEDYFNNEYDLIN